MKIGYLSGFCCVCHVFLPLVSIFGLFPVLVWCHYELTLVQLCLSRYVLIIPCILVLSFEFDFVWSTCDSPVYPVSESCLDVSLKTIIWVYVLVCVFLFLPRVCTVTVPPFIYHLLNNNNMNMNNYNKIDGFKPYFATYKDKQKWHKQKWLFHSEHHKSFHSLFNNWSFPHPCRVP